MQPINKKCGIICIRMISICSSQRELYKPGKRITDPTSGMRMVNESIIKIYADCYPKDYPEPESVVAVLQAGKKVEEYPVVMRERKEGVSSISPLKSVYYMIKVTLAILVERIRRKEYKK